MVNLKLEKKVRERHHDDFLVIKRAHALWISAVAGLTPVLVIAAVFYNAKADLTDRINHVQLDTAMNFVPKADFQALHTKLDSLGDGLSEIKGMIEAQPKAGKK